eukprot:2822917-Pleurochrysis_carterae.AAC.3
MSALDPGAGDSPEIKATMAMIRSGVANELKERAASAANASVRGARIAGGVVRALGHQDARMFTLDHIF